MPRPVLSTIHIAALRHNLLVIRQVAAHARVWAIVKANAYGHGIERVFEGLRGADGFGLLDLDEAVRVRQMGWRGPILLLEGVFEQRDLELCSRLNLWHTVHCDEQIHMLATHKTEVPHRVFLKMNSGMNRLGFRPEHYRAAWTRLNALPQVDEISMMTHFSDADGHKGVQHQMQIFNSTVQDLPGERSFCNSAATLRLDELGIDAGDWVRPGIALYGSSPDAPVHTAADWCTKYDDIVIKNHRYPIITKRRICRLWLYLCCRQIHANRRGSLWLCRRLSTSLQHGYACFGERCTHSDGRACQHGHAHG